MNAAVRRACFAALLGAIGAAVYETQVLVPNRAGAAASSFDGTFIAHRVDRTVLVSDNGTTVAIGGGTGPAVLVLGYTRCTDQCPVTLAKLTRALEQTQPRGRPRAFFVTTDPQHDAPAILHRYLAAWNHRIVGLAATAPVTRRLQLQLGAGLGAPQDHDTRIFVLDGAGDVAAELPPDVSVPDLRKTLSGQR